MLLQWVRFAVGNAFQCSKVCGARFALELMARHGGDELILSVELVVSMPA